MELRVLPLQRNRSAVFIEKTVGRCSACQNFFCYGIFDCIGEAELYAVILCHFCTHRDSIPVLCRDMVFAADIHDRYEDLSLFDLIISNTALLQDVQASLLKPTDIVRVVHDRHLIRFIIVYVSDIGLDQLKYFLSSAVTI